MGHKFRKVLFWIVVLLTTQSAYSQISPSERDALIELYSSTDGDNWWYSFGWRTATDTECEWYGVICKNQTVVALNLQANGLAGELPTDLIALQSLEVLALQGNQLSGNVPDWLDQMPALKAVDLSHNALTGTLPQSALESNSLEELWLRSNQLGGAIPAPSETNTSLNGLWLSNNSFDELSPGVADLEALMFLWLDRNEFTELPATLVQLTNLVELDVSSNQLTALPDSRLSGASNLTYLDAGYNQIESDIRQWLTSGTTGGGSPFQSLQALDLAANRLSGSVPGLLFELPELRYVSLRENLLSGAIAPPENGFSRMPPPPLPPDVVPRLYVDLSYNTGLHGALPETLVRRTILNRLEIERLHTEIEFGDCYAWRQVQSRIPPIRYVPGEPVRVDIYLYEPSQFFGPRVADAFPSDWDVIEDPDCYCDTEEEPARVISARLYSHWDNQVFSYYIAGPDVPDETEEFTGYLTPGNGAYDSLICGHSTAWIESIFADGFLRP